jgi:riboflavin synthase alpha subunit
MLILVCGSPKSGETLIYQMLWDILEDHGMKQEHLRRTRLRHLPGASNGGLIQTSWLKFKAVMDLSQEFPFLLARTQGSITPNIEELVESGSVKLFLATRALKDSAQALFRHAQIQSQISDPNYAGFGNLGTLLSCNAKIKQQQSRIVGWQDTGMAYQIPFEDLMSDPYQIFCDLIVSLGLGSVSSELSERYQHFGNRIITRAAEGGSVKKGNPPMIMTGLVSGKGHITSLRSKGVCIYATVETNFPWSFVLELDQVSHSGFVCPMTFPLERLGKTAYWEVEVPSAVIQQKISPEWSVGSELNLERLSFLGDDIGGQLMFGAEKGAARITQIETRENRLRVQMSPITGTTIAEKPNTAFLGNNIALTVSRMLPNGGVEVHVSPFTKKITTLGAWQVGDVIAIEPTLLHEARVPPPF